jgi:hypothetical protein
MGKLEPLRQRELAIATELLRIQDIEKAAILMLRGWLLYPGHIEKALGLPKVNWRRFEFHVPGGRIDLLLCHADGGMTIVEAKAAGTVPQIAAGIGQLCYYASVLPQVLAERQRPKYIRRLLCAPIEPQEAAKLLPACALAGVTFRSLPTVAYVKRLVAPCAGSRA